MAFEMKQIKVEPVYDEDMVSKEDLPYSNDDFSQLLKIEEYQNNFTIQDGVTVIQSTESVQFDDRPSNEACANDNCLCLICNASYPTRLILEKHLRTHDSFFSVDSELFIENQYMCTTDPSGNKDVWVLQRVEQSFHNERFRNFTFCNGNNNDQTNSIDVMTPVVCSLGNGIIDGATNYRRHWDDMHDEKSAAESERLMKPEEPGGPDERIEKTFKKSDQKVITDESEDEYGETTGNVDNENEQRLKTNYNTEKYQTLINKLVFENHFVGRINPSKLIGPYFWKNSLAKEELVQYVQPKQFQGKLKLVKCKTCVRVFTRPMQCSLTANKKRNSHSGNEAAVNDDKTGKTTCEKCSLVYNTAQKYRTHVRRHSKYSVHCNACLFDAVGN